MKKILLAAFALAILFTLGSCKQDQVLVRFQNSLDSNIEDARMEFDQTNVQEIGLIAASATTGYLAFDYFEVGDGLPSAGLKGKKNGEDFWAWTGNWCGTGVTYKQLDPGKYTIEITKVGDEPYLEYRIKFVE
ncbi:MAG: hypothetical protein H7246_06205 [Phycisphaerae bacterium]|nr:hypothetical protein [Saprospiraceae bacterium]